MRKDPALSEAKQQVKVRKRRSRNSIAGILRLVFRLSSVIIALGLAAVSLFFGGVIYLNAPPERVSNPPDESIRLDENGELRLEIKSGETAYSVGRRLENARVIRSRYLWYLLFRLDKEFVKAGLYRIKLPASQIQIRAVLIKGEELLTRVTIPEGVTLGKASRILEDSGVCGAEDFLAAASSGEILNVYNVPGSTMEGFLYPDTYLFPMAYPAHMVVRAMADTFFRRLNEISPEAPAMNAGDIYKRIIVASIVEREYRVPEEAPLMAGVFYNRLDINMPLQSCATVEYVITEIQGRPHPEILYNRDIEIRDPYNTYIQAGLPPGPISAPGETALRAAFNPAPSNYFYFRLTDQEAGRHYFSRTLDDHIRAGALYVKGR